MQQGHAGTEDGKFPSVDKLAAHILRIDSLMAVAGSNAFGGGFSKQASVQNRGKGNGNVCICVQTIHP